MRCYPATRACAWCSSGAVRCGRQDRDRRCACSASEPELLRLSVSVTTRAAAPAKPTACTIISATRRHSTAWSRRANCWNGRACWAGTATARRARRWSRRCAPASDVVFDIDWQGHRQLRAALPGDVVGVFILPPTLAALEAAARPSGDDAAEIARRMQLARDEISHWPEFDHVVVNDDLDQAVAAVRCRAACRTPRQRARLTGLSEFVDRLYRSSCQQAAAPAGRTRPPLSVSARRSGAMPAARSNASPPSGLQRAAQHLAPLAERGRGQPLHRGEQRRRGLLRHAARGRRPRTTPSAAGRRRRAECAAAAAARQIHCASTRQPPIGGGAGRGADPFGHLLLEHQRQPLERRRLAQPADQQRRRDVVGQVGDHLPRRRHQRRDIDRQRVAGNHTQPSAGRAASSCIAATARRSSSTTVTLAASDAEQRARQPARARADLHHMPPGQRRRPRGRCAASGWRRAGNAGPATAAPPARAAR